MLLSSEARYLQMECRTLPEQWERLVLGTIKLFPHKVEIIIRCVSPSDSPEFKFLTHLAV